MKPGGFATGWALRSPMSVVSHTGASFLGVVGAQAEPSASAGIRILSDTRIIRRWVAPSSADLTRAIRATAPR